MSTIKQYSVKEAKNILRLNGFVYVRSSGDHDIYKRDGNTISISVNNKDINKMLWRRLMKENNLIV